MGANIPAYLQNNGICHDNLAGTRIVFKHLYKVDVHRKKEGTMKKVAAISLALASSVFALDEYLPIAPKAIEVDVGVTHNAPDGGDASQAIPLAVKYGIMEGLTLELATDYSAAENNSGVGQPQVALKYAIGDMGLAPFLNVLLPVATGDRSSNGWAGTAFAPGVVYGKNYGQISAVALASYQINMDDGDFKAPDNALTLFLKPGYIVNDKLVGYVGLNHLAQGDISSTKLVPGVTYTLSPTVAFEANLPYVVAESNSGKGWTLNAYVYYTIPGM